MWGHAQPGEKWEYDTYCEHDMPSQGRKGNKTLCVNMPSQGRNGNKTLYLDMSSQGRNGDKTLCVNMSSQVKLDLNYKVNVS